MKALVTGALGQDGTLLTRLLRSNGADVLGVDRVARPSGDSGVMALDITDRDATMACVRDFKPDRIFHLAACHHSSDGSSGAEGDEQMVAVNFRSTETLANVVARHLPQCRLLFAASSQMYTATAPGMIVSETTPMKPSTFYGWTKAWSRELLAYYRDHRSIYAVTAILFNHESVLRGPDFITRKVTSAAARAKREGKADLKVRDIGAAVDWSAAEDVVEGMSIALTAPAPADYVIASGKIHTVANLLDTAFARVSLQWRDFVSHDAVTAGVRPSLVGDASRLRSIGWKPRIEFKKMIETMVDADFGHASG